MSLVTTGHPGGRVVTPNWNISKKHMSFGRLEYVSSFRQQTAEQIEIIPPVVWKDLQSFRDIVAQNYLSFQVWNIKSHHKTPKPSADP